MRLPKPKHERWTSSISARLTLHGATTTFLIGAMLCGGLYLGLSYGLLREVDVFLEGEISEFKLTIAEHWPDQDALTDGLRHELGSRPRGDLAFRLFDESGRLILSSLSPDPVAEQWRNPPHWLDDPPRFARITVHPDQSPYPHRTCSLRTTAPDGRVVTAQASYRLDIMSGLLSRFRQACFVAMGLALMVSLVTGKYLARTLLLPIRALIDTTDRVSGRRLSDRVPRSDNGDELDRLATTINAMLERIERHVLQVRQLTTDASHELRTPIAALRGKAELALTGGAAANELRNVLAESIEEYDRLSRITEDLLLLARADAGQQILRTGRFRLNDAVADVVDLFEPLAQERGVRLHFAGDADVDWEGDEGRIRQVMANLLDNALRHTPASGRIDVELRRRGDDVVLTVSDTGAGIEPEHLVRVFDRFYRADRARSREAGGAGLGLSICKTLIEAHGGAMRLVSEPRVGTIVTVILPARVQAPFATPASSAPPAPLTSPTVVNH